MHHAILTFVVAAVALPAWAAAGVYETPENRLIVVPLNATDFEVIEARGEGPRGIWCAAASYVDRQLTAARTGDLYVKSPRGPSVSGAGRIGVVFTISPDRVGTNPVRSYSVGVRTAGETLPVQHAYQFCKDYIIDPSNIFYRLNGGS